MNNDRAKAIRSALLTAYNVGKAGGGARIYYDKNDTYKAMGGEVLPLAHPEREANLFKFMEKAHPEVLNENGTPKILYHGSIKPNLKRFDLSKAVEVEGGLFLTDNPDVAHDYTYERAYGDIVSDEPLGKVHHVYVNMKNPYIHPTKPGQKIVDAIEMGRAVDYAKKNGHDGVIVKNIDDSVGQTGEMGDTYVAFHPNQIKSAVGNRGTFDPNEPDITKAGGGKIIPHGDPQREANLARHMEGSKAPPVLYHGTPNWEGTAYNSNQSTINRVSNVAGFYADTNPETASGYALDVNKIAEMAAKRKRGENLDPSEMGYGPSSQMLPVHMAIKKPFVPGNSLITKPMLDTYAAELKATNSHLDDYSFENWAASKIKDFAEKKKVSVNALNGDGMAYQRVLKAGGYDGLKDGTAYVAFEPTQIKSAVGNRGTFDPKEPDITKAGGGDVDFFHGSYETAPTFKIDESPRRVYSGIFGTQNDQSARSHGENLYTVKIPENKILSNYELNYEIPYEKVSSIIKKLHPHGDQDIAHHLIVEDGDVFKTDPQELERIFRTSDAGEAGWAAQDSKGKLAKALGYDAVQTPDEHGEGTHLIVNGTAFRHTPEITKAGGGDAEKAKRRALMIARGLHKAAGGDVEEDEDRVVPKPTLFGEKPAYAPLPAAIGGNGPPAEFTTTPEDQPDAPVFHSRVQELLKDPNSLGMMKMGTPHQWTKRLGQEGSKKEEMNWLELYQGKPNVKLSRQEMLDRTVANLPKISNVVLGSENGERDLSNIELEHGRPEIEEPDSTYISEIAYESLQHDLHEFKNDPSFFGENHVKDGIKKFAENWLEQDPNDFDPKRLNNFLEESVNHGWIYPEEARRVLEGAAKNDIDPRHWSKIVEAISDKVSDNFNDPKKHGEDKLNQFSMISDLYAEPNKLTTHDYVKPLESAISRLHNAKPKFMEELTDHLQNSLNDDYEEHARENYYNYGDAPTNRSVEVFHGDNQDTYSIREDDDGLRVEDPNGTTLGTVYSEDEAEHLIRSNFAYKYDMLSSTQKGSEKTKTESVPEPENDAKFDNSSYMLAGLKDYREEPITLEPKAGAFNLGHYPTNTLGHIRYGTVYDEQGNRLLHVDEAQSDWHQKGRDLGYDTPNVVANKQKAQKLLDVAREDLRNNRHHIGNSLGLPNPDTETTDRYAGLMLLDPENLDESQKQAVLGQAQRQFFRTPEIAKQIFGEDIQDRIDRAGPDGRNQQAKNLLENFQNYSRTALGNDYRDNALSLNNVLQQHNDLKEQVRVGSGIPEAPWKESADFAKLVFKKALRTAADHGYAGISLSPGWVQSHRWGGNKGHVSLYDNTFGGALGSVGKDLGLKKEYAKIPVLDEHAKKLNNSFEKDLYKKQGNRAQALYLTPESRRDIKKRGFELFKRGGPVEGDVVRRALNLTRQARS